MECYLPAFVYILTNVVIAVHVTVWIIDTIDDANQWLRSLYSTWHHYTHSE